MRLLACGPWLNFSTPKKVVLFVKYWPTWFIQACWKSKKVWLRYYLFYKVFKRKPMMWADVLDLSAASEETREFEKRAILDPMFQYDIALSGKGKWLWYESEKQLEERKTTITYPVDWDRRGPGWYPF